MGAVHLAGLGAPKPEPAKPTEAAEAWNAAKDTTNVGTLEPFIGRYKGTFYVDLALARIEELKNKQIAIA